VAIIHAFVENQGDAWTLTSSALDRFVEGESLLGTADAAPANDEKSAYQRYMAQTGKRVAEMQMALASRDDIEDFRPEQATPDDTEKWIDSVIARSNRAFARLDNTKVNQADVPLVEHLTRERASLRDRLAALLPPPEQILKIRHHGDFHLGQTLIVKEDIFIIDFEGEPRRALAERRMKAPAARDVAGLIRSIDYSVSAALERSLQVKSDDSGLLRAALAQWRDESTETFLTSYRAAMTDARLWPVDPAAADDLLRFFLLEKAFYEIEYELAHRPDWLRVALNGALRVLGERELA
jgi:maltose alpha-D-glucosyltransferase/alpha-amylase